MSQTAPEPLAAAAPTPPAAEPWLARPWRVLRAHPPFARYMAGTAVSLTGTWMQVAAQGFVVSQLTDKAAVLGWINLASGLPMLLLSLVGGSVADRYDKRRILIGSQVVQLLLAVAVGWLILQHQLAIWHIVVVAALLGVASAFEVPADSALVPELVDGDSIRVAIAVDRALFHSTRFLGPALAGLLIAKVGAATAFFVNAGSFLAMAGAILTLAPRPVGSAEEEEKRGGGMKEGLAYVRGDKPTLCMLGLLAATTTFLAPFFIVMMPLYVKDVLGLGADKLGYLMSVSGLASMLGAVVLLAMPPARRFGFMVAATSAAALGTAGLAMAGSFWAAVGGLALTSLGTSTGFGLANTVVQERAPRYLRGRVSALAGLSFFGLLPFTGLGMSALADHIGMRTAMGLGAGCYAVVTTALVWGPGRRGSLAGVQTAALVVIAGIFCSACAPPHTGFYPSSTLYSASPTIANYALTRAQARAAVFAYCEDDCLYYAKKGNKPQLPYRRTFARALAGELSALHTVFTDQNYHSGDNEDWIDVHWAILHAVGDARFADFLATLPAAEQDEIFLYLRYSIMAPEREFWAYFERHFPRVTPLYRGYLQKSRRK